MGKCEPQQTDAGSEPDECVGQTEKARDARDGAGQGRGGTVGHAGTETSPGAAGRTARGEPGAQKLRRDGGTREGSCRTQPRENPGHRSTSREEGKAQARARRCGAEETANEVEVKRVSWAARCL